LQEEFAVSNLSRFLVLPAVLLTPCLYAGAQPADTNRATLFQNVRVFDGKSGTVGAASNVLVEGNVISRVSAADIAPDPQSSVTIVAGGGRVLMPGLIEAHWHAMMVAPSLATAMTADMGIVTSPGRLRFQWAPGSQQDEEN
jgi:predicted amidohydrolase YtcJ